MRTVITTYKKRPFKEQKLSLAMTNLGSIAAFFTAKFAAAFS